GGHAGHQGVVGHVLGDHRPGGDTGPGADRHRCHAHRPGTHARAAAHGDAHRLPVGARLAGAVGVDRPRIGVVGEHCGGADEHTVLEVRGLVHQGVVLHLAVLAQVHPRADVGAAADDAPGPDHRVLPDLDELPDAGVGADLGGRVHLGGIDDHGLPSRVGLAASAVSHTGCAACQHCTRGVCTLCTTAPSCACTTAPSRACATAFPCACATD